MTNIARNKLFAEKAYLIDWTLRKHYRLLRACYLSNDDVRQDLAVRMLQDLDGYNAQICPNLDAYLLQRLHFAVLNMRAPSKRYGVPYAPPKCPIHLSLDAENTNGQTISVSQQDDPLIVLWLMDEIAALPKRQRAAINKLLYKGPSRGENKTLQAARRRLWAQMRIPA